MSYLKVYSMICFNNNSLVHNIVTNNYYNYSLQIIVVGISQIKLFVNKTPTLCKSWSCLLYSVSWFIDGNKYMVIIISQIIEMKVRLQ